MALGIPIKRLMSSVVTHIWKDRAVLFENFCQLAKLRTLIRRNISYKNKNTRTSAIVLANIFQVHSLN